MEKLLKALKLKSPETYESLKESAQKYNFYAEEERKLLDGNRK